MAKVRLQLDKSIDENAGIYYDKAKKAKKKLKGLVEALEISKKKLADMEKKAAKHEKAEEEKRIILEQKKNVKKEWFEKFRWFITSEGFLVIGGRDATTNEIIVKKHTSKDDLVFHTEMSGSPFFVIKADSIAKEEKKIKEGKKAKESSESNMSGDNSFLEKPGDASINEAADATISYSRAWKSGIAAAEVFYVSPKQLSKEPQSGEFVAKGSFVIRGKKNIVDGKLNCAVGIDKNSKIIAGPVEAVKKHAEKYVEIQPITENRKASDTAKEIQKNIGGDIDDIIRMLPSGASKVIVPFIQ